ncbi:Nif11 family protein [Desulfopila sp. IMCC35006]|uniref:Nif11-like leader peptide family natural product precursor n=1 Tax=Desulfopila sp. IMCC35006 TaxID=2569542 RepID=UPI0010AD7250|nr:Nif11-like leader peptide family natural product precursor [Desulfopila sp. IMCC35006]TKB25476.1 Nif11 family protein [Desulfopila sp. IMCC35006]
MSKKEVERFLIAGGEDKVLRIKYDKIGAMPKFVASAVEDGFDFTEDDLKVVLRESGDSFETSGNPPKRDIWWF